MKLVVLVPSTDSLATAGVRIRYHRLRDALRQCGVALTVVPIDSFDAFMADCDVAIISKCYDARALMAGAILGRRNIRVGLDLFDDYFSDATDSRLGRYRTWLRQMLRLSQFAMCSTAAMARVISGYRGDIAVHILNDPAPALDRAELLESLELKQKRAASGAALRISWFGIGDNPHFPVGLTDLAAFGGVLREVASEVPVELEILTNKRALDASGLACVADLPVAPKVGIWSAQLEAQLLRRSDVCLLPVNAQPFSVAKSMNRALTALASGCQVLSLGYPLYAPLGELIYRDARSLVEDWRRRELRLRAAILPAFEMKIEQLSSASVEARRLANFLQTITLEDRAPSGPLALLHGFITSHAAHLAVKAAGGLSIATPFCSQEMDFDAIVEFGPGGRPSLVVAVESLPKLAAPYRRRLEGTRRINGRKFLAIDGRGAGDNEAPSSRSLPVQLALYEPLVEAASDLIAHKFGASVFLSEESALPVEPAV